MINLLVEWDISAPELQNIKNILYENWKDYPSRLYLKLENKNSKILAIEINANGIDKISFSDIIDLGTRKDVQDDIQDDILSMKELSEKLQAIVLI